MLMQGSTYFQPMSRTSGETRWVALNFGKLCPQDSLRYTFKVDSGPQSSSRHESMKKKITEKIIENYVNVLIPVNMKKKQFVNKSVWNPHIQIVNVTSYTRKSFLKYPIYNLLNNGRILYRKIELNNLSYIIK